MSRIREALAATDRRRSLRSERARTDFQRLARAPRTAAQLADLVELAADPSLPSWLKFGVAEVLRRQAVELSLAQLWRVWTAGAPFYHAVGRALFGRFETSLRIDPEMRPRWIPPWVWELPRAASLEPRQYIVEILSKKGRDLSVLRPADLRVSLRAGLGAEVALALLDQLTPDQWRRIDSGEVPDWTTRFGASVQAVVRARAGQTVPEQQETERNRELEAMLSAWWQRDQVSMGRCAYWAAQEAAILDCRRIGCADGYVNLIEVDKQGLAIELDSEYYRYLLVDLEGSRLMDLELESVVSARAFSVSRLFGLFPRNVVSIGSRTLRVLNTVGR